MDWITIASLVFIFLAFIARLRWKRDPIATVLALVSILLCLYHMCYVNPYPDGDTMFHSIVVAMEIVILVVAMCSAEWG